MYSDGGARRRSYVLRAAVGVVLVVALVALGVYAPASGPPATTAPNVKDQEKQPPLEPRGEWYFLLPIPAAQPSEDAVTSALEWLAAYRTVRYDDPLPSAWIDRVRPVVTDGLAAQYEQYRQGSVGADWTEFVAARCASMVEGAGGVIPEEAPRSLTRVSVQVAGSLRTRCQHDHAADRPDESLAATLTLDRGEDGRWRVDQRLY